MLLISNKSIYSNMRDNIAQAQKRAYVAQREATTGVRLDTAADDPVAASRGSVLGASLATLQSMGRAGSQAKSRLDSAESAMDAAQQVLSRVKELGIAAISAGLNAEDRMVVATELRALGSTMLSLANAHDGEGYVFSGFTNAAPFDALGVYAGDSGVRRVDVAPNTRIASNVPGDQVFNVTGGQNVLAVVGDLATACSGGDLPGMALALDLLDASIDQVNGARAQVAAARIVADLAEQRRSGSELLVAKERASAIEVDQAASFVKAVEAQTALEAAIAETTRILGQLQNNPLVR